jgi:seryl-tRNA synthetase
MLDLDFIRQNPESVRRAISSKAVDLDLDKILALDQVVRNLKRQIEKLRQERNAISKAVSSTSQAERVSLTDRGRAINEELKELDAELTKSETNLNNYLLLVPNIPAPDEPEGTNESDNVEHKRWGEPAESELTPQNHLQILARHRWADFERGSKTSGSRSYILMGEMVRLEMALWQLGLDHMIENGFTSLSVPSLARETALVGTGHFPVAKDDVYFINADSQYLSGTAEVIVNSLHAGEIMNEADLPIRYAAFSPCFRREAGAAGRDVRGLMRVHQFNKLEQYVICRDDVDESRFWFNTILSNAEAIVQKLEIPYRVIRTCTGEMGLGKVRMWDIECWIPSQRRYRETHSASELYSWQARRANIRYRDSHGKVRFVHTLNNTAIATPRIMVPMLENHQRKDGSIYVPPALRPYLGGADHIG